MECENIFKIHGDGSADKAFAGKADILSSIPKLYMVEGKS